MSHRFAILFVSLFVAWTLGAQTPQEGLITTVVGEIYDAETGQPLPNVNVYVEGTHYGTTTTPEGVFLLRVPLKRKAHMVVSSVGYQKQHFVLQPGQSAGIDVTLSPAVNALQDLVVVPGENPALALMKRVREQRQANDIPHPQQQARETQVYLSDIQAKHLRRHLWQSLRQGMVLAQDSSYLLPLYACSERGEQRVEHTSLLSVTDWQVLLTDYDQTINFYRNLVPFYSTSFVSPLASDGNTYYHFILTDSVSLPQGKTYTLQFRTRNPYYATFNGTMQIDSASCALVAIDAQVPRDVSVNYLHALHIRQTFALSADSRYCLQQEQVSQLLDFAVKADSSHVFPSLLLMQSREYDPMLSPSPLLLSPDSAALAMANAAAAPAFRVASFLAYVIQNGYIPTGSYVEFGNVSEILHINPYETVRLGLPLRTTEKLSKVVCLEAFAAYGFGDKAWKGAGMVHINLPTARRNILSFRYADEYASTDCGAISQLRRENSAWYHDMNFTSHLTRHFYRGTQLHYPDVRRREFCVSTENDWTDILETRFAVRAGREGFGEPTHDYASQSTFRYASLSATFRLGWQEKKVDFFFHRKHVYGPFPSLYLHGELGSVSLPSSTCYDLYGRLSLMLRQQVQLGVGGQLDYLVEGGLLLGKAPYNFLQLFEGNQSYAFESYRFTLMYNGQYAADRYLLLHTEWNGKGCLFNLIPGIRYLRLRELLSFKLAWGAYSARHLPSWQAEAPYADLKTPYVEVGVGIGNILRIADLYSVWRLTHRNDPDAPRWSMRFRFRIEP